MPTIRKRISVRNGRRVEQWQVIVRRVGHRPWYETYPEGTPRSAAWEKALEKDRELKLGKVPVLEHKRWRDKTLRSLIEGYRQYMISPSNWHKMKRSYHNEEVALKRFLNYEPALCSKPIFTITTQDIQEYCDRALLYGHLPSTVRRNYVTPIRSIWNKYARKGHNIPLHDIFQNLQLPDDPEHRKRILLPKERPILFKAIEGCRGTKQQELWLSLVLAALNTSLPRSALLRLQWKHVDFDKRNIFALPVKKQKEGRWLPMTMFLSKHLKAYFETLSPEGRMPQSKVFPITPTAHEQAWKRIVKRAGLYELTEHGKTEYLRFHDLRHTALTEFGNKNPERLDVRENAYMKGSKYGGTLQIYEQMELVDDIRAKLDAKENCLLDAVDDLPAHFIASYRMQGFQNDKHYRDYKALWLWDMADEVVKGEKGLK